MLVVGGHSLGPMDSSELNNLAFRTKNLIAVR